MIGEKNFGLFFDRKRREFMRKIRQEVSDSGENAEKAVAKRVQSVAEEENSNRDLLKDKKILKELENLNLDIDDERLIIGKINGHDIRLFGDKNEDDYKGWLTKDGKEEEMDMNNARELFEKYQPLLLLQKEAKEGEEFENESREWNRKQREIKKIAQDLLKDEFGNEDLEGLQYASNEIKGKIGEHYVRLFKDSAFIDYVRLEHNDDLVEQLYEKFS